MNQIRGLFGLNSIRSITAAVPITTTPAVLLSFQPICPLHSLFFLPCRSMTTSTALQSSSSSKSSSTATGTSQKSTTTTTMFGGKRPRITSEAIAGRISEGADTRPGRSDSADLTPGLTLLTKETRAPILNPTHLSRGHAVKSAHIHRELHDPNPNRLNHAIANHIRRCSNWNEVIELVHDHMHHMSLHNFIRAMEKLVKTSPTRVVYDMDAYNKFGRFMNVVEAKIHEMDTAGVLQEAFGFYHYLRQCLRQMYLLQTKAQAAEEADPELTKYTRQESRLRAEALQEQEQETQRLDELVELGQEKLASKYDFGRRDEKTAKVRARERRAGRAFTSIAETHRANERDGSARARSSSTGTTRKQKPNY